VVYNWVDEKAVQPVKKEENPLYEEFGLSRDKFTVVYTGNLGNAQNISIVLDGAKELSEVQFAVFGSGGLENEIRKRIEEENLINVHLNPLQPVERVSFVYSLGDACIVSCKEGLGGSAMPSKSWSIMSCGRPVVASFDEGELKEILENNDCGVFSHAGNVQEFVDAIKSLAETPDRCTEMGANARHFIEANLTKEVGAKKYVEIIKSVVKK
jgi:glycosyltransferase involved in cell wall biosynthesis